MSPKLAGGDGMGAGGAAVLLALYLLSGILLPFIVGMAAAYLLDPAGGLAPAATASARRGDAC